MMGGVGDYSGGLVLQVATSVSTTAVAALVASAPGDADTVRLQSEPFGSTEVPLSQLRAAAADGTLSSLSLPGVSAFLRAQGAPFWASYVFGSLAVFARETGWLPSPESRLSLEVTSTVPTAQGVSSSASVEVAVLRALRALSGRPLSDLRLAHIAQSAENYVVGAPCGLMDQLASSCGEAGRVLPITCRPDALAPTVPLPPSVTLVGWPSGVKHSVAGALNAGASPYLVARTATFMALALARAAAPAALAGVKYAAELTPSVLRSQVLPMLPATMTGREFTAAGLALADALSVLEPDTVYPVREALAFPVEESFRCALAQTLLAAAGAAPAGSDTYTTCLAHVGELMRLGNAGYNAIGLGCQETDLMVARLREMGVAAGIYGARVSGGGSGGTIAVLCERAALPALEALAKELIFDTPFTGLIH